MSPDDALKYAIKEIDNALEIVEDPDLYAPLFKNVSVFKRYSYNNAFIVLIILLALKQIFSTAANSIQYFLTYFPLKLNVWIYLMEPWRLYIIYYIRCY